MCRLAMSPMTHSRVSQSNTSYGYVKHPASVRGSEGDNIAECAEGLRHPMTFPLFVVSLSVLWRGERC